MRNRYLYIYYFVLIFILALYTNMSASPNIVIRLGYLAALVIPLVNRVELFPAIIICALGISKCTFAYPFMPTDMIYYIVLSLWFATLSLYHRDFLTQVNPLFYIALLYVGLNDIALQGELSQMTIVFFIFILFFLCMEDDLEIGTQILPIAFILISLTISYWALFIPEAQINNYNKAGDMQQTGWTDPNYLSTALGTGLVIAVRDLIKGGNKLIYISILCLTIFGSSMALLFLASRGAILSVILAITSLFVLSTTSGRTKVITIIAAGLFLFFLYTNQYMDFLMARVEAEDGTGAHRTELWISKIEEFSLIDNPLSWIFGVGQDEGLKLGIDLENSIGRSSTHNDFLSMLIYYGFVGLAIFFCMVAYPIRICSKEERPYIIALLAYLLACSMTIEPLARGNFVYWGLLFYIMVYARQSQEPGLVHEEDEEGYDDEGQD